MMAGMMDRMMAWMMARKKSGKNLIIQNQQILRKINTLILKNQSKSDTIINSRQQTLYKFAKLITRNVLKHEHLSIKGEYTSKNYYD